MARSLLYFGASVFMRMRCVLLIGIILVQLVLNECVTLQAQPEPTWTAFNDLFAGNGTGRYTTAWNLYGTLGGAPGNAGPLTNAVTGERLPVILTITTSGSISQGTTSGAPNPGTPAYELFNGYIDWSSGPSATAPQISPGAEVNYVFSGLNPNRRYQFIGTSVRGGNGGNYALRWTLLELLGAASTATAHTSGDAIYTNGLPSNQVALNSGQNSSTGDYAGWSNIDPGTDGTITLRCTQYTGAIKGGTAGGSYGYALMALRLAEYNPVLSPAAFVMNPTSRTVLELSPVTFTAKARGNPIPILQWYRNGQAITNATNDAYALSSATMGDHQSVFTVIAQNVVSNLTCTATSTPATLYVTADTTPPTVVSGAAQGLGQVRISFSKRLESVSAADPNHFAITNQTGSLAVNSATLDSTQTNVVLSVSPMTEGVVYTVTVSGVTDQTAARNTITENNSATFTAVSYQANNIGNPVPAGTLNPLPGGYDLTAGGSDIGGTSDQCFFSSLPRNGDFDVQVRLEGLESADLWAKAGLMARNTTDSTSAFVGIFATPGNVGVYFQNRSTSSGAAVSTGSLPVNYPNTWLRLKRVGNQFTGYAGNDGRTWTQIGSTSVSLAPGVLVGLAVSSHGQGQLATARFRELSDGTGQVSIATPSKSEPLAQSSRRTQLVISEIMYDPHQSESRDLEFVELYNPFGTFIDISGYKLSGDIDYLFPAGTVLPAGSFLVVARNPADVQAFYGLKQVFGPYRGSRPNEGGTLRLRHRTDALFLEIQYGTRAPWPDAAHGLGHSLVLARPSYGENDPRAWAASDRRDGSPGRAESIEYEPMRDIVINEFLANSDEPLVDFIELYNHSNESVDISGCWLSDDKSLLIGSTNAHGFRFPPDTQIPPRGFISIDQNQLAFALDSGGEMLFLSNSNLTRVIDAVTYSGQRSGISSGRYPDGSPDFYPLKDRTPGIPNSGILLPEIVINEIMYDPISGNSDDEYVELYNRSGRAIELGGWKFSNGISYHIPPGVVIPADGYLVVAKNATNLLAHYPAALTRENTVGDYSGTLAQAGETLVLSAPESIVVTNQNMQITTNNIWIEIHKITYGDGGRWGPWAKGGGSSLELADPNSDSRQAANWADSDETTKAPWTLISYSGILDNGDVAADQLQVLLQGAGECLIDDVEVLNASGVNQIANSDFSSGSTGWVAEGTQDQSSLEATGGYNGGQCYHVRAVRRADNQINRIRTNLKTSLQSGSTGTIRAKVRWLKGHPEILFRLRGKWLEAVGQMTLPTNPGTPGMRNSRSVTNTPPAIFDVAHAPILPASGETVRVTARVSDPDGIGTVTLNYRVDPSTNLRTVTMTDDGSKGDVVAKDGIYTGIIPGQNSGALVAFHVTASDATASSMFGIFPKNAPARQCLVRFGEAIQPGNIPVYRIWITQSAFNTWSSRPKLNNTPLDLTFVLGNHRVIYNADGLYAGSPYISGSFNTPSGNRCGYSITMPEDDPFLGGTDLVLDWPGGHGNETTAIQEEMAYYIADQINMPHCLRHFIRLVVNGVTDMQRGGVFQAINQPARDFVKTWSPDDSDGELYKIERGYEFSDSGGLTADPMPRLLNYTTTGGAKKTARYRWNWLKRAYESANNFTNIFNLVDALNAASPEPYTSLTESIVDVEEWMRVFAFEHIINNFDSWGHEIGKNMFAYKPEVGKWQLYVIDLDWLMLVSPNYSSRYSNGNGPLFISDDPTVTLMYNHPPFLRAYYRAVQDAVEGPMMSDRCNPVMDDKYSWLVANGVTMCDGYQLTAPTAVKKWFNDRRNVLLGELAKVSASFKISSTANTLIQNNRATLLGTAPVTVKTITVNGVPYEPVWSTVTNFSFQVPLMLVGTNTLNIQGYDWLGRSVNNTTATLSINYQGPPPSPASMVMINEWMASNNKTIANPGTGRFDDWFELYNAGTNIADLAGCYLTSDLTNKFKFQIPAGYKIPAGGFLLVWADNESGLNSAQDQDLHVNFKLTASGEAVGLFDANGNPIDAVTFGLQTQDVSEGRFPDGSQNIAALPRSTPRTSNQTVPLQFLDVTITVDGPVILTWSAQPGKRYQIQYREDLVAGTWINLGSEITADNETMITRDTQKSINRCFYRIVQLP